jgi:predicted  nucleic acid-binding Zn-ribbon protein
MERELVVENLNMRIACAACKITSSQFHSFNLVHQPDPIQICEDCFRTLYINEYDEKPEKALEEL